MKFKARIIVEGPHPSDVLLFQPLPLLEHALRLALLNTTPEEVAQAVARTTAEMVHSLSCKRRTEGEIVSLSSDDPDGYNGAAYEIAPALGEPTECLHCGNPACIEWPTLFELAPDGKRTGKYAYHVSECHMNDKP